MKKALVILLALTMVMSMFAMVSVSAADEELAVGQVAADYKPEGEAIKTAEDFAAMKADGKYYLANDITISETYYDSFTGTFDGNGKTLTTSTTVFDYLDGTVKNLTVAGSVTIEAALLGIIESNVTGILAHFAAVNANTTIDNVCNLAPITSYASGAACFVGRGCNGSEFVLTITNSVNHGNVTTNCNTTNNYDCGGFIAQHAGLKANSEPQLIIDNCVNNGVINADGRPGGICGNVDTSAKITNCVNNGPVQAIYNYCGGIAGRFGRSDYLSSTFVVENCVNNADLYQSCTKLNPDGTNPYKNAQIGGIVGYMGNVKSISFKNCVNNGDIDGVCKMSVANFGGISGGHEKDENNMQAAISYENCVNNGKITAEDMMNGKNITLGGIAAYVCAADVKFINCTNTGDVAGSVVDGKGVVKAGGICGNVQNYNSDHVIANTLTNTGNVTVDCQGSNNNSADNQAAGIFGYVLASGSKGVDMQYCVTTGVITGNKKVAGLIGYINSGKSIVRYNIVAGKIVCTDEAVVLKQGENTGAYNYRDYYTFNYNDKDYYFQTPYNADKFTINGTVVTPVYTIQVGGSGHKTQVEVSDGATAPANTWCYWVDGVDQYWFKPAAEGTVTIDGTKAYVGGVEQAVAFAGIQVFEVNTASRALLWSDKNSFEIKAEENIIEAGAAGVDYVMGAIGTFGPSVIKNETANKYTAEQFASGEVAYKLNDMIGETKFYQNLNKDLFVVDVYPTTDSAHAKVVMVAGVIGNQLFEVENDAGSPATGDAIVYVVVALAVSTISLAAVAVVKKVKEN